MSTAIVPMYPVRRAVEELTRIGRTDLRQLTVRRVVSDIQNGRDGLFIARQLQAYRLQQKAQGGAA